MKRFINSVIIILSLSFISPAFCAEEILTWDGCLAEAGKNNPELISAVEIINQEKAGKDITASALYPQISTNLGVATRGATSTSVATGVKTSTTTDTYSYGVSGTQLLFDGSKTRNNVKSAAENIKAAQQGYRFTSSQVRLSLRTAFINLLKAQELIQVAEDIVKIRRDNLELITLRYQSGLEHKGALLTAEANVAQAKFELAQAKRDVGLAQRQLTKAMGRKEFKLMSVKGDFTIKDAAKEKPDFEVIVKNNPSLLQAQAKRNAASFSLKAAYAKFFPQLSGSVGADRSGSRWPPKDKSWDAALSLTLPLFEGGLKAAQVTQAQSVYRQAEADARDIKDSAVVSLEQAWAALQDADETVEVQNKSLEATVERSKIAEAQYSTGFITFDSWIIIEDNLVSAKKSFLNAQTDVLLAEANWIQAKGETLEYAQ
ncbi:MAG TPA: TolC family protein [Candidatus Omnitrophota bacterium]|nr:TolC family protein [Candidatus Omnitrophota bacterium]HPT39116.1 TolC family protein [Candidatus Omnitrophota bacterium]